MVKVPSLREEKGVTLEPSWLGCIVRSEVIVVVVVVVVVVAVVLWKISRDFVVHSFLRGNKDRKKAVICC